MTRRYTTFMMLAFSAVAVLAIMAPGASAMTAMASDDDIKIGLTYHGSTVDISGVTRPDVDLIMKITGVDATEKLMRKDKIAGMWMNVEELTLNNVPEIYYLRSTRDPETILSADQLQQYVIGYPVLREKIDLTPAKPADQRVKLLDDFIKYKESGKLYSRTVGAIDVKPDAGGEAYSVTLDWPYQAPPGEYKVEVFAVQNGQVVDSAQSQVTVERDGAIKSLSDMAKNNGALYGLAAIGVSVTAGFGVGIVFKGGGGSH
ncbi:MAG: TIGR02186 family protein [Thermoleophilia bacterium]